MKHKAMPAALEGALVLDKPPGRTSHDVVDAVRRALGFRQVGHLGTLDPQATGVLVLLLGRATRVAQFYAGRRKRYRCTFRFGFATDTYDAEGAPMGPDTQPRLDREQLAHMASGRVGRFLQVPPPYSAKKIHGRPAHELARKNKPVELQPAEVEVFEFELNGMENFSASFTVECAAGTYVRSLAHQMGIELGCGAHLAEIVRTAVGEFALERAVTLEDFERMARAGQAAERIIPLAGLLDELPRVAVLPVIERQVRHGSRFQVSLAHIQPGRAKLDPGAASQLDGGEWKPACLRVFNQQEELIAIAKAIVPRTYQPVVVLDAEA